MIRPQWWINREYQELPAYSFVQPINPDYLPKEWLKENSLMDDYLVCYTAKGLMQIPEALIEQANKY